MYSIALGPVSDLNWISKVLRLNSFCYILLYHRARDFTSLELQSNRQSNKIIYFFESFVKLYSQIKIILLQVNVKAGSFLSTGLSAYYSHTARNCCNNSTIIFLHYNPLFRFLYYSIFFLDIISACSFMDFQTVLTHSNVSVDGWLVTKSEFLNPFYPYS